MPAAVDLTDHEYDRWTVLERAKGQFRWLCRCRCGTVKVCSGTNLRSGKSRSCGCLERELTSARFHKHGMTQSPEYEAWLSAKARCTDPGRRSWLLYGGRGIRVCDRWAGSFAAFFADVGERPTHRHSLDRVDPDGHYSCGSCGECVANGWPANCRWATATEQVRNRRSTLRVPFKGRERPLAEVCAELGMPLSLVTSRLAHGWSVERALTQPPRAKGSGKPEHKRMQTVWSAMVNRCHDKGNPNFDYYGGRGIGVCQRWRASSAAFIADMGERPGPGYSVDRTDNDGGYWCGRPDCNECGPEGRAGNCRWATAEEQVKNRRAVSAGVKQNPDRWGATPPPEPKPPAATRGELLATFIRLGSWSAVASELKLSWNATRRAVKVAEFSLEELAPHRRRRDFGGSQRAADITVDMLTEAFARLGRWHLVQAELGICYASFWRLKARLLKG